MAVLLIDLLAWLKRDAFLLQMFHNSLLYLLFFFFDMKISLWNQLGFHIWTFIWLFTWLNFCFISSYSYAFLLVIQRQPEIHLFAAWFKEHSGDIAGARAAYQLVHAEISPGLLEAIIKHANMERRLVTAIHLFILFYQPIYLTFLRCLFYASCLSTLA